MNIRPPKNKIFEKQFTEKGECFRNSAKLNTIHAKYFLSFLTANKTAKHLSYISAISSFMLIYYILLLFFPTVFHCINYCFFFFQNIFKIFLFSIATSNNQDTKLTIVYDNPLPIYSILVPLYQEEEKLESIIWQVSNFNYPKDKLDIKIIIEEDDNITISKLETLQKEGKVSNFIDIIKVPYSTPRTKPKALNYAFSYCLGEYLVIYDAEDRPDKDQLLKAVQAFKTLPSSYACLQAKLNFYNADENFLTKCFSLEYRLWFDYLLKSLSILNLPMPLGGTSNHFKLKILYKLGMWDAYNVSEDAELGIRIFLSGYKQHLLDSYTLEEAPTDPHSWLKQRARWIKGYIQTFMTYILCYARVDSNISLLASFSIYIFMGISSYSLFAFPWLLIIIMRNHCVIFNYLWFANSLIAFSYIYISNYYVLVHSNQNKPIENKILSYFTFIFFPFYFTLHIIASYIAMWEIIFKPFVWNKTKHGVSKIK